MKSIDLAYCVEGVRWLVAAEIIDGLASAGIEAAFASTARPSRRRVAIAVPDEGLRSEAARLSAPLANPYGAVIVPVVGEDARSAGEARFTGLTLFATSLYYPSREGVTIALKHAFARATGRWRANGARGTFLQTKVSEEVRRWLSEQGKAMPPMLVSVAVSALGGGSRSPFWHQPSPDLDFAGFDDALLKGAGLCGFAVDHRDAKQLRGSSARHVEQFVMQGDAKHDGTEGGIEEDVEDVALRIVGMLESEGGPEADFFLVSNAIQRAMGNFMQ